MIRPSWKMETDLCPQCGSGDVAKDGKRTFKHYGPGLAVCRDCDCLWEFHTGTALTEPSNPLSPFKKPCNNCAFRPGSKERGDCDWGILMVLEALGDGADFHCHKGVPISSTAVHGFDYPDDEKQLRLCRGALDYKETGELIPRPACAEHTPINREETE